ncbi:MAG: hypothetical protein COB67_13265 [SAR324 cluster bacterium]|uniref:Uncharacterized protein n=1 Tax=SAR324 cluster bacterium TaxID=2024889 RepID=A0A2A4SMU9_9DELT|nr:MAG: hypothetical protein COB67_13265 [SAR324 cluster bacterium]
MLENILSFDNVTDKNLLESVKKALNYMHAVPKLQQVRLPSPRGVTEENLVETIQQIAAIFIEYFPQEMDGATPEAEQ